MLEKIIEAVEKDSVVLEAVNEWSETKDVSILNSYSTDVWETGRFSITLDLFDKDRNNYEEVLNKLRGEVGKEKRELSVLKCPVCLETYDLEQLGNNVVDVIECSCCGYEQKISVSFK